MSLPAPAPRSKEFILWFKLGPHLPEPAKAITELSDINSCVTLEQFYWWNPS